MEGETAEQSGVRSSSSESAAAPGLVMILAGGQPCTELVRLDQNPDEQAPLERIFGRDDPGFADHPDTRVSRRHVLLRYDGRRFHATDLESRNGTLVDGVPARGGVPREVTRVLRIGDSLLVPMRDLGPFRRLGVETFNDGWVEGPALKEAHLGAARAAETGGTLHITGESGAGKEGIARAFHAAGPSASGRFVAVNCANIPENLAESLLFGAVKGAYSGADAATEGYLQAAHRGTLFLDEVAELSPSVQAKLLRVLETGEMMVLGSNRLTRVDLRFCSATHRDLRAQVAAGKLREDLYFRIASPRVVVPALRDRPEEIPWLIKAELARVAPTLGLHVTLVEACLLRPWPGNVRELLAEVRTAAQAAIAVGAARVDASHLSATAGSAFSTATRPTPAPAAHEPSSPGAVPPPSRRKLEAVLRRCEGNVSRAARELGLNRGPLRRLLERYALDAHQFAPSGRASPDDSDDSNG